MASFGEKRLEHRVMYLATVRPDGYPRVHPFTPFVGSGRLFAFMEPTSPKARDLQRNKRYSMHSLVDDMYGTKGEFQITGEALLLPDSESRREALASCPYTDFAPPLERHVLFEFKIDRCFTNFYSDGKTNMRNWKEDQSDHHKE
jgi:hypothetical protein